MINHKKSTFTHREHAVEVKIECLSSVSPREAEAEERERERERTEEILRAAMAIFLQPFIHFLLLQITQISWRIPFEDNRNDPLLTFGHTSVFTIDVTNFMSVIFSFSI